jgi:hypothetical protein
MQGFDVPWSDITSRIQSMQPSGAAFQQTMQSLNASPTKIGETITALQSKVNPSYQKLQGELKSIFGRLTSSLPMASAVSAKIPGAEEATAEMDKVNAPGRLTSLAAQMNAPFKAQFDAYMPMFDENMGILNNLTSNYLQGRVPQDVVDQVSRQAAATGMQSGLFAGGLGRNLALRDLGLTSLQMQQQGMQMLQTSAQIAQGVMGATMPFTGKEFITDPTSIYRTMAETNLANARAQNEVNLANARAGQEAAMAAASNFANAAITNYRSNLLDPNTVFNTVYQSMTVRPDLIYQSMTVNPNSIFETAVNQAQYNSQIANQNALNSWLSRPLPGQFDVTRGQFVGMQPGTYSSTAPTLATGRTYAQNIVDERGRVTGTRQVPVTTSFTGTANPMFRG